MMYIMTFASLMGTGSREHVVVAKQKMHKTLELSKYPSAPQGKTLMCSPYKPVDFHLEFLSVFMISVKATGALSAEQ